MPLRFPTEENHPWEKRLYALRVLAGHQGWRTQPRVETLG